MNLNYEIDTILQLHHTSKIDHKNISVCSTYSEFSCGNRLRHLVISQYKNIHFLLVHLSVESLV